MNIKLSTLLISSLLMLSVQANADSANKACDSLSVTVNGMSNSDQQLLTQIDQVENDLARLRHTHGRGSHLARTRKMREQLNTLEVALQTLHDKQFLAGCPQARQEASDEARITKLEHNLASSSK